MPVTIKAGIMKYKDTNGEYVNINMAGDKTTAEQIAAIKDAGGEQIDAVQKKGNEVSESIADYERKWQNMSAQGLTLPEGASPTAEYENGVVKIGIPKNSHSYIQNGNWYAWDDTQKKYVDTGIPASGVEVVRLA